MIPEPLNKQNNDRESLLQYYLSKNRLRFPPALELLYNKDYFQRSIRSTRIALITGAFLYAIFGILDYIIVPAFTGLIWMIRYAVVCPLLIITLMLSYLKLFERRMQLILAINSLVVGLGIIAMIVVIQNENAAFLYYAGLILVLMWSYTFVQLKFRYALVSCWGLVLCYECAAIFIQRMLDSPHGLIVFINNNFFFLSANIIGMFASYLIDLYMRKNFLQRELIAIHQHTLENERNELKERDEVMQHELEMAQIIQLHLIPKNNPTDFIYSLYKPMRPIGGDLYDFIRFSEHHKLGIFLSDVSGHGVPAALIASMLKSIIINLDRLKYDPGALLCHLNDVLFERIHQFVTVFYCIIDFNAKSMRFTNAGHVSPFVITEEKVIQITEPRHIPIAIFNNDELNKMSDIYITHEYALPDKCKLLFYTDGLIEARKLGDSDKLFSSIIKEELLQLYHLSSRDLVHALFDSLVQFRGSDTFDDDISIVCVEIE